MRSANPNSDSPLLKSTGWDACVEARLLRADEPWQDTPEFRSHGHALRRLFEDLHADAVLCVERRPTVCILRVGEAFNPETVRHRLWNLAATTLLVVEGRQDIRVFSTLVKPTQQDREGKQALLTDETITNLEAVALALRLREMIRRIETGAIYREHKTLFDGTQAVDRDLLENLKSARNLICPRKSKVGYQRAHALIGRFLFSCYLLDRGIIGPPYLKNKQLPEATDMLTLLNSAPFAGVALGQLFEMLHRDFNGSLFGETAADLSISEPEVAYLQRLLAGENLRTGQMALFKLYDFSFIPVELISSIYEGFLGAEAETETAQTRPNQLKNHGQRRQGAYYTPPRLAELTVDIATEGWATLLDKRCFDPACGSGVFLVILFVRMAEEWRRRNPQADTSKRYAGLMELLENNLHGGDIELTACLVTCFSLYLAFLDQMEPREVMELRDVLERDTREKLLPRILWEAGKPRPKGRNFATVREVDFFTLPAEREFDLVIGNPPWVSRKEAPAAEAWLFSGANPHARAIGWKNTADASPTQRQTLFPAKEVAAAFMWKAALHLKPNGRVCQILPSRVLLSNNTSRFQSMWLRQHRMETVWLLADYRFILFPTADCPGFIGRYRRRAENEVFGEFEFVTPKVEMIDPRQALIPLVPEDQKMLRESEIVAAAERNDPVSTWKRHHWGTPRDARLIERLLHLPKLDELTARPPRMTRDVPADRAATNQKRWWKGQGFQPRSDEDDTEDNAASTADGWTAWWNKRHLFFAANTEPEGIILSADRDCSAFGNRSTELRRTIAPELTRPPLVVVNKGFTKACYSDQPVVFQHAVQSIAGPSEDEGLLLFLAAYLDSALAKYLVFHTSATVGIERGDVHLEEILALPFPLPAQTPNPAASQRIVDECGKILRAQERELKKTLRHADEVARSTRQRLGKLIFDYFGLSGWERQLVADTVEVFRPSATPSSLESEKLLTARDSKKIHRQAYAETLTQTFGAWTSTKKHLWVEGVTAAKSHLALVTLGVGRGPKEYRESDATARIETVLTSIQHSAARNGSLFRVLRGFAFYESERVHILKPLNRRHWTRTAALNDADEILTRMMQEGGWGA